MSQGQNEVAYQGQNEAREKWCSVAHQGQNKYNYIGYTPKAK